MNRTAPIVRLTLAYAAGVAAGLAGVPVVVAPLGVFLSVVVPNPASRRPLSWALLMLSCAAGFSEGAVGRESGARCVRDDLGASVSLRGRLLAAPRGGSAPFEAVDGCGPATVVVPAGEADVQAGALVDVVGVWRSGRVRPWIQAQRLVPVDPSKKAASHESGGVGSWRQVRWRIVGWRDGLVARLHRLFPEHGPLVSALVLARGEGLDPDLRASFAVTGIAHLLAISGFHVGLIAGLLFSGLRLAGWDRRRAGVSAAGFAWVYVGVIGFPNAAVRAALILTFAVSSRARGLPASRWGPLSAAALLLLLLDARRLASPGFQLSFAGAAGLIAWARPLERTLSTVWTSATERIGVAPPRPRGLLSGLAAGVAATLATAPIVAWHFERLSLVGIPMTLVTTPLVSLALPATLLTLAIDFVSPRVATFLAGGTSTLLDLLVHLTQAAGAIPWASAWTSRPTVLACLAGVVTASLVARSPRIGGTTRRRLVGVYMVTGVVAWPLLLELDGRGRLELVMIDVGQGDAIAVRSPRSRWLLVDAGPPGRADAAAHPVVRTLRGRGVRTVETLVLTHPDLDHVGGALPVLQHLTPNVVIDPMLPAPKTAYAELVENARARGIPWIAARAGDRYDLDGVSVHVLHPTDLPSDPAEGNAASVVLLVEWNGFRALLTGDAYVDVERAIAPAVGDIDVLKVGHHGSDTSTDSSFLAVVQPEVALISAGRGNRYGHPTAGVVRRLRGAGATILRTDREGTIRIVVRRSGAYEIVRSARDR